MSYQYTPLPVISTKPQVQPNGDLVYADGTIVKGPKKGPDVKGAGNKGTGSGAGGNHLKWNAIETIVNRGKGGGSDPNAWDAGDIGLIGNMTGVTVEDLENRQMSLDMSRLQNDNWDLKLQQANVTNPDGSFRTVQWGDTEESLSLLINQTEQATEDVNRFNTEKSAAEQRLNTQATETTATNSAGQDKVVNAESERDFTSAQNAAKMDFELSKIGLDNDAKMERYERELERYDRQQRRDSIAALVAGLATLGGAFAM